MINLSSDNKMLLNGIYLTHVFRMSYEYPTVAPKKDVSYIARNHVMTSSNGNIFRVTGHLCREFLAQRPVTKGFAVFFELNRHKQLLKQSLGRWYETPSRLLWRRCNDKNICYYHNKSKLSEALFPHIQFEILYLWCIHGYWPYISMT